LLKEATKYKRNDTFQQQRRRPRKNTSCHYDAGAELKVTPTDLTVIRSKVYARRMAMRGLDKLQLTKNELEEIYKKADAEVDKRQAEKPTVLSKDLIELVESLKKLYVLPGRFKGIFKRRKDNKNKITDRLPRGERLEVITVVLMYLGITTNYALNMQCLVMFNNQGKGSPAVLDLVEALGMLGYSERRVREAYRDACKTGLIHQELQRTLKGEKIRSRPSKKYLPKSLFILLGMANTLKSVLAQSNYALQDQVRKASERSARIKDTVAEFFREAEKFAGTVKSNAEQKTNPNKAPPRPRKGRSKKGASPFDESLKLLNKKMTI